MNKATDLILKKIKAKARQDARNRHDRRFLDTLAFLTAKGLLKTNIPVRPLPNKRLRIEDALWAGLNVEPRILEVLPAAIMRLERHFDFDIEKHPTLAPVIRALRAGTHGPDFYGVLFEKAKAWLSFPLPDKRTKPLSERKVTKHFRLSPHAIEKLKEHASQRHMTQTEVLESLLSAASFAQDPAR